MRVETLLGRRQTDQRRRRGLITSPSSCSVLPAAGRRTREHNAATTARCPRTSRATIRPSPARAEPHDASTWLPVPDLDALPTIEVLLDDARARRRSRDVELIDLTAIEATIGARCRRRPPAPSPTTPPPGCRCPTTSTSSRRSTPCSTPTPTHQAAVVAEAEAVAAEALAVAEASSAPSPARAEPHDAATWLPLPSPEELRRRHRPAGGGPAGRDHAPPPPAPPLPARPPGPRRRGHGGAHRPRRRLARPAVDRPVRLRGHRSWSTAPGSRSAPTPTPSARSSPPPASTSVPATSSSRRPTSALHDGIHVDVLRAFPVTVDVDGRVRTVRTVETSADKLAKQLKLDKLTAVRNNPGRLAAGATVVYRTRVSGSLTIDDQKVTVRLAVAHRRRAAAVVQREAGRRGLRDAVARHRAARRRRRRRRARRRRDLADDARDRVRHRRAGRSRRCPSVRPGSSRTARTAP